MRKQPQEFLFSSSIFKTVKSCIGGGGGGGGGGFIRLGGGLPLD